MGGTQAETAGASLTWLSSEPVVVEARRLISQGRLAEAERAAGSGHTPAADEVLEIIRRLRLEYSLSETQLLAKIQPLITQVTPQELRSWIEAGHVRHRLLDGQLRCFRREPANLLRFCAVPRNRQAHRPEASSWSLTQHLADVLHDAAAADQALVAPVHHRVEYRLQVSPANSRIRRGAHVRCWLPFPHEHPRQRRIRLLRSAPKVAAIAPATSPHRSIYLECLVEADGQSIDFSTAFEFEARAYCPTLDPAAATDVVDVDPQFLSERPPHILFTPQLQSLVREVAGAEPNPLLRARRIFQFICENIRYCAEEEYCLIPGFSEKALQSRRGDCGIQAMLFITMCRCAGIPTRWQSGWQTRPRSVNMHDWAEFYIHPWGWLPADPSYGLQESDDPGIRWFYFGHQDSYRLIVNTDYGHPLHPSKHSLRSEPADFQRGEVEVDGHNLYFNEWSYEMRITTTPARS